MVTVLSPPGVKLDEVITGTGSSFDQGNEFALMTIVELSDGGQAMYVHAAEAISKGHVVTVDENGEASKITTASAVTGHRIGIAADVLFADNEFGWVRIRGTNFNILAAASCAADVLLYTTGTAGVLDDTSTSTLSVVAGIRLVVAVTSSGAALVECIMSSPMGWEDPFP